MRRNNLAWIGIAMVLASAVTGCGGVGRRDVTFHDPNMDFSIVQSVAVMPFENLTTNSNAADRVRDTFMTMLQATGSIYVVPPGEVSRGISRAAIDNPAQPTVEEVIQLAKLVEAEAVITGTVREYGDVRSGSASSTIVSVSLAMMESQTGRLVWSASSSKGGVTTGDRLFGGGGEPMNVVTERAIKDLLDKLFAQ